MTSEISILDTEGIAFQTVRPSERKNFPSPDSHGRLLAIGDIHGHLGPLKELLQQVGPTQEDRIVFLGDYIDRGPDSCGVIDYLLGFQKHYPNTIFLRGNHEQVLSDALLYRQLNGASPLTEQDKVRQSELENRLWYEGFFSLYEAERLFFQIGGKATLQSYGGSFDNIPSQHLEFLNSLSLAHMENPVLWDASGRYCLFVHAGVRPRKNPNQQREMDLLWLLHEDFEDPDIFPDIQIIHGHKIYEEPQFLTHRIGLDTGAGEGKKLTCCEVLTRRVWQEYTV